MIYTVEKIVKTRLKHVSILLLLNSLKFMQFYNRQILTRDKFKYRIYNRVVRHDMKNSALGEEGDCLTP